MTKRSLIQRINRALAKEGEVLRKTRGMQMFLSVGEYYATDCRYNVVTRSRIDLEELGRKLGVLKPDEVLISDG
jgi:hypothetical protein